MRMPISRVRSVTLTSMMFMMPMPPTMSDTLAMAPSRMDMTLAVAVMACASSSWVRTVKSGSTLRCRGVRVSVMACWTLVMASALDACTRMELTKVRRETRFMWLV